MQLEDYIILRINMAPDKSPIYTVFFEDGIIYIERKKSPRFMAVVNIREGKFNIDKIDWIDEPMGRENTYSYKAFHFLNDYFIVKK